MALPDLSGFMECTLGGLDVSGGNGSHLILNPHVLTAPMPRQRTNVRIPGKGSVGRRSEPGERNADLEILVTGWDDPTEPAAELEVQQDVLRAATIDAAEASDGTISVSVTRRDGVTFTGDLQVNDFLAGRGVTDRVVVVAVTMVDALQPDASA